MPITSIVNTNANSAIVVGSTPAVLGSILEQALAAAALTSTVRADRLAADEAAATASAAATAAEAYAHALQLAASQYVPSLTGDVLTNAGQLVSTIQPNVVTNSKLAKMPQKTIKGNDHATLEDPQDLTAEEVMAMLDDFQPNTSNSPGKAGFVPAPAIGDAAADMRLCADGTWKIIPVMTGDSGSGGTVGYVPAPGVGDAAANKFFHASGAWMPQSFSPIAQQTVVSGPGDSNGIPTSLPATNGSLSIYTQNVDVNNPLVVHACRGFDVRGQLYRLGFSTGNLSWANLTASVKNYLFFVVEVNGALTPYSSVLAPVYIRGGNPSTTSGQFTFDQNKKIAYLGNGLTAVQTAIVPFGECVCNGSTVTSSLVYATNGMYDSGWNAVTVYAAAGVATFNCNLGVLSGFTDVSVRLQCTATELGYSVGDVAVPTNISIILTGNTVAYVVDSAAAMSVRHKSTGVITTITAAKWNVKVTVNRNIP